MGGVMGRLDNIERIFPPVDEKEPVGFAELAEELCDEELDVTIDGDPASLAEEGAN